MAIMQPVAILLALLVALSGVPAYQAAGFHYQGDMALTVGEESISANLSANKLEMGALSARATLTNTDEEQFVAGMAFDGELKLHLDGETQTFTEEDLGEMAILVALAPYIQSGGLESDLQTLLTLATEAADVGLSMLPYTKTSDYIYSGTLRVRDLLHAGVRLATLVATEPELRQAVLSLHIWQALGLDGEEIIRYAAAEMLRALAGFDPNSMETPELAVDFAYDRMNGTLTLSLNETEQFIHYAGSLCADSTGVKASFTVADEQAQSKVFAFAGDLRGSDKDNFTFDVSITTQSGDNTGDDYVRLNGTCEQRRLMVNYSSSDSELPSLLLRVGRNSLHLSYIINGVSVSLIGIADAYSGKYMLVGTLAPMYGYVLEVSVDGKVTSVAGEITHSGTGKYTAYDAERREEKDRVDVAFDQVITTNQEGGVYTLKDEIVADVWRGDSRIPIKYESKHTVK